MGKKFNDKKIDCLVCHNAHRADNAKLVESKDPKKKSEFVRMLKRSCTDCHANKKSAP
jgi:nitrate/TMAO reductase-like tetraheme cytochrome c subunit